MNYNRMVAVCDIMGFEELVRKICVDQLVSNHLSTFRQILYHCLFHKNVDNNKKLTIDQLRSQTRVGIAWFSDTILLYALDDENISAQNVVETAGWLVFETLAITPHTKLRLGISYGEFYGNEDEEIFVGKALIDAYRVEQIQQWSGGALSVSAMDRMINGGCSNHLWIVHYDIPLKDSPYAKMVSNLALNWTSGGHHEKTDMPWSEKSPIPDSKIEPPDLVQKWQNTRDFHRKVCKQCRLEPWYNGG